MYNMNFFLFKAIRSEKIRKFLDNKNLTYLFEENPYKRKLYSKIKRKFKL